MKKVFKIFGRILGILFVILFLVIFFIGIFLVEVLIKYTSPELYNHMQETEEKNKRYGWGSAN